MHVRTAQVTPEAMKAASDAFNPGVLRTYGPGIVAGLAATGAMGGFQPNNPGPSELAAKRAAPQRGPDQGQSEQVPCPNLPGVQYDASGNITGSKPWEPTATMADVRVPANSGGGGQYNFASVQPRWVQCTPPAWALWARAV